MNESKNMCIQLTPMTMPLLRQFFSGFTPDPDTFLASGTCTPSIHMQCDAYKNRGFGTKAETLALEYAFSTLQLKTVYADALIKNKRSCHVLQKVGFIETDRD